ncbi:MAG: type I methionyl aminopeptidase [bacterium]|nr:type I methionyl aminopeptidase [bacterium]
MIARTEKEIEALREGGKRLAKHLRVLSGMVQVGVTPRELEDRAREMVAADGDELAFYGYKTAKHEEPYPSGLCVSVNDVIVHSPASENSTPITDGDVVCLDFGIKHDGFFTDHAVTVIAGTKRNPEDERLLKGTQEAIIAGIAAAKIGNTTGDIGYAVERVAKKHNFGFPRNLSGHGVGLKVHEEPHVPNFGAPGSGVKLEEGLVIAIEPMMALGSGELFVDKDGHSYRTKDGSRTAHFEHTIIITKNGPEVLTRE